MICVIIIHKVVKLILVKAVLVTLRGISPFLDIVVA